MVDEMAEQEPSENSQYMTGKHQAINEFVQAQFQSIAQTKQFNNSSSSENQSHRDTEDN